MGFFSRKKKAEKKPENAVSQFIVSLENERALIQTQKDRLTHVAERIIEIESDMIDQTISKQDAIVAARKLIVELNDLFGLARVALNTKVDENLKHDSTLEDRADELDEELEKLEWKRDRHMRECRALISAARVLRAGDRE